MKLHAMQALDQSHSLPAGMLEDGLGGVLLVGGRLDDFDRLDTIYRLQDGDQVLFLF
jgi:hypothetical protein